MGVCAVSTTMMSRIHSLDIDAIRRLLEEREVDIAKLAKMLAAEPNKLPQIRCASQEYNFRATMLYRYALGYELAEVRASLLSALSYALRVIELRGTERAIPLYEANADSRFAPGDPQALTDFRQVKGPNDPDWSMGNSKATYKYMLDALTLGDFESARWFGERIFDPSAAGYVGRHKYAVVSPFEQQIAYAFKSLFAGDPRASAEYLHQARTLPKQVMQTAQREQLRAILEGDGEAFIEHLIAMLEAHRAKAYRKDNKWKPELYLCQTGLGHAMLALGRGIVEFTQLPSDSEFFPIEMLRLGGDAVMKERKRIAGRESF